MKAKKSAKTTAKMKKRNETPCPDMRGLMCFAWGKANANIGDVKAAQRDYAETAAIIGAEIRARSLREYEKLLWQEIKKAYGRKEDIDALYCTKCQSTDVIPLIYGQPSGENQPMKQGKALCGGCDISPDKKGGLNIWHCNKCEKEW